MEGPDIRRIDGKAQVDRFRRSRAHRPIGGRRPPLQQRRLPRHARAALPQRSHRLVQFRSVTRNPRRRPAPLRCRSDAGGHGTTSGRRGVPGPHHDEAHMEPPDRCAHGLRPFCSAGGVAPGRTVSAVAQGSLDRLARTGTDLRALRRHRGPAAYGDHRIRVARASRFGRSPHRWRRPDLRSRRRRPPGPGPKARCGCAPPGRLRPTDTSGPRPGSGPGAGNRWATWAGSTRTDTSTSATGPRT